MNLLALPLRWLAMVAVVLCAAGGAAAEQPVPPVPAWQEVITLQIEAFRRNDATSAFSFAGAGFQNSFPSAQSFFDAVISSGYAPIRDSVSHGFGPFEMTGEAGVVQQVRIVAHDQAIYEATYQLTEEPTGWRVQGVQLRRTQALAI